jgi:hypothetical protein
MITSPLELDVVEELMKDAEEDEIRVDGDNDDSCEHDDDCASDARSFGYKCKVRAEWSRCVKSAESERRLRRAALGSKIALRKLTHSECKRAKSMLDIKVCE